MKMCAFLTRSLAEAAKSLSGEHTTIVQSRSGTRESLGREPYNRPRISIDSDAVFSPF